MIGSFTYENLPCRVVFGSGTLGTAKEEVKRLGGKRALVLTTSQQTMQGVSLGDGLGPLYAGIFSDATMHTPVEVTERALTAMGACRADCVISLGGGSTTGLGKALALRTGVNQLCIPTTYAGSEMTPILGETRDGRKTTVRSSAVLPETVIYDVDLTMTLPAGLAATSGINAIAHAAEALYARDANPVISLMAEEGIRSLAHALPVIAVRSDDHDARTEALYGAWLCGVCLGTVGMALHHKLCHVLGGRFDLPHSEMHTIVLPHALAYNAAAVPDASARIAKAVDANNAATGLFDLSRRLGTKRGLREIGMPEDGIDRAADLAMVDAYWNPRSLERDAIRDLIARAWAGEPPAESSLPPSKTNSIHGVMMRNFNEDTITDAVLERLQGATNARIRQISDALVRHLHAFVREVRPTQKEWEYGIDFLTRTGHMCDDKRQEFILLSDTLGISMLIDAINHSSMRGATESTVLGPFFVQDAPEKELGEDISNGMEGDPLFVTGSVSTVDGLPVAGALVDVWHSDDDGYYDVQQLDEIGGLAMRARFRTDASGRFNFWSIKPAAYPIPHDGPVGEMLKAQGRHPWRPAHVHFMISAPGFEQLVTHVFVAGDKYLDSDVVFGVKDDLVREFVLRNPGEEADGRATNKKYYYLNYNFGLKRAAKSSSPLEPIKVLRIPVAPV